MGDFYGDEFPYFFECSVCERKARVTWRETLFYVPYERVPRKAAREALRVLHLWSLLDFGPVCRRCIEEAEHLKNQK